jgi:hypothetical protein
VSLAYTHETGVDEIDAPEDTLPAGAPAPSIPPSPADIEHEHRWRDEWDEP